MISIKIKGVLSLQMSLHSKRFVFPYRFLSLQTSHQVSLLGCFSTIQTVQMDKDVTNHK